MAPLTVDTPPEKLDDLAEFIARAKAIIAGRIPPPEIDVPEFIKEFHKKEFAGKEPPPTAEAIRFLENRAAIQHVYHGTRVLCLILPDECYAVLAEGEAEIWAVYAELEPEERAKVIIETTGGY